MWTLVQDLRYALRTLKKGWVVTSIAIVSLALAIGGNTTVFSLVDAFLFRPLPYDAPDRVVLIGERQKDQPPNAGVFGTSLATYADLAERSRTIALWSAMQPRTLSLRNGERAEPITGVAVTPGFFDVMRVSAWRGRTFLPEEGVQGAARVALLGHDYWVRTYGDGRSAIGEVLTLDGEPTEIIGVLPPGFSFLATNQDIWIPIARSPTSSPRDQRTLNAVGRMADGATMEQVRSEMIAVAEQLEAEHPLAQRDWTIDSYNLRFDIPTTQTRILFGMLQGSVFLVLLIACVNITNLLLARGQHRAQEMAVRTMMGAGRWRIVRQLLTESAVMVTIALALGVLLGFAGIRIIANQWASILPEIWVPALDYRTLSFTIAVSAAAGLVFGLVPALQSFRRSQAAALREGARGGTGRSRRLLTRGLVVAEIALSFVALGGGSLLVRSFLQLRSSDPGFDADRVLTALVTVPASKVNEPEQAVLLTERILERARALPGVAEAALASALPQSFGTATDSFRVAGATTDANDRAPRATTIRASDGYLATLGIELVQGRFFDERDRTGSVPVAVVNRRLAEVRFPGRSAVGAFIEQGGQMRQVVGVIGDIQQALFQLPGTSNELIYLPVGQAPDGARWVMLRAAHPATLKEPLRLTLQQLDPDLAVSQMLTMEEYVAQFFVGINVFNTVLGGFGLMALLLAAIGTYGMLAWSVSQRRREIGIRMAVGARSAQLIGMIARQGLTLGIVGLLIGVALTLPLVAIMNSLLQGLSTVQPGTLVLIALVLFAVTALASWLPASRAAAVDPVRVLNDE